MKQLTLVATSSGAVRVKKCLCISWSLNLKGVSRMNTLILPIIQYAVLLSIPLLCALVVWLCHQLVRSLPTQQREALEQFARIAVQKVEQQDSTLSGTAKKQLAISLVIKLFNTFKIPVPPEEIIDAAIEAAVFFINQIPVAMGTAKQTEQKAT